MTPIPIRPNVMHSATKQKFLDYVAQQFDEMTEHSGEPVAIVFGMCNAEAVAKSNYITEQEGSIVALLLARITQVIQYDALEWSR